MTARATQAFSVIAVMCAVYTLSLIYSGYLLLLLPGLMAGLLLWSRIVQLIVVVGSLRRRANEAPGNQRLIVLGRFLVFALLFGGLWLAFFLGLGMHFDGRSPGWPWFFAGIAITPFVVLPSLVIAWRNIRASALVNGGKGV